MKETSKDHPRAGKQPFFRRADIWVVAGLLLVALVLWLVLRQPGGQGAKARVEVFKGEQRTEYISLAENGTHQIDGAALSVHLEVEGGRIRFINSVCPDHDCEGFGWLQRDGEWAACLPAGVTVTVEE